MGQVLEVVLGILWNTNRCLWHILVQLWNLDTSEGLFPPPSHPSAVLAFPLTGASGQATSWSCLLLSSKMSLLQHHTPPAHGVFKRAFLHNGCQDNLSKMNLTLSFPYLKCNSLQD